jgi:hypothetical protein
VSFFWSRGRRDKHADAAPTVTGASAPRLAVVEFWAADRRTLVGVDLSHERLTDLINREDALTVLRLDGQPEDPAQPIEMRPDQEWSHLEVGDVLLVLPPPQLTDPQRRLHRPRQPVEIVVGRFVLTGLASVPPGAQAAAFLLRQNARYAPITRAVIRDSGLPGFEQRAEVVLVNMRRVDTIRDVGLDEPEPFAPAGTIGPNL